MKVAYVGLDEVNAALVRRWTIGQRAGVVAASPAGATELAPEVAIVLDVDHLPEPWRRQWLELAAGRPAMAYGYNLTDRETEALRRVGVTVVRRRLTAKRFANWYWRSTEASKADDTAGRVN